ncbi:MAG: hypothetical protein A2Z57_04390 [Planctomycetes bacterium RIFCSPHIGHO2_12_39_6]|nr:MAG: hypothetical protein A2Z57_04390 [Planctomycetes bacterium RIFCSPHIGHO2_12_39_6]
MAQIADKKGFDEGLDQDTEPRKVGGLRDAVNIRYGTTDNGNDGTAENTKGNLLIVNPNLPAGTNKCIGGFEDKRDLSIIFFNFNSNNDHGIYRFYSTTQTIEKLVVSSVLNFNLSSRINSCDLIDELLYWTDGDNSPRKINIDKANETAKKRKFNLYFGDDSGSGEAYFSFITDPNGNLVASWFFFAPTQDSLSELTKLYLANVPVAASAVAVFTSCQQFVEVEFTTVGGWDINIFCGANPSYSVAQNFYPGTFTDRFINRIKDPFQCEPLVEPKEDSSRKNNLVQNKVFQFRIRPIYDDNEKAVWSPYSDIPVIPSSCTNTTSASKLNYIELDFNDLDILDPDWISVIKGIEVSVREHNTGKLQHVQTLEQFEFLGSQGKFKFYNDSYYPEIDPAEAFKNYDAVARKVNSHEFVENRLFDGGLVEGYNPECIDASLALSYEIDPVVQTFNISGKLFIKSLYNVISDYVNFQPIHDTGAGVGFGGFMPVDVQNGYITDYDQQLPLGGFVMYLAGTGHYGVSQQNPPANGASVTSNNVWKSVPNFNTADLFPCGTTGQSDRKRIRCEIEDGNAFSRWKIAGVTPGKYVLRVASHRTTQSDLGGTSLAYQKTSTYTLLVGDFTQNECELEVMTNGDIVVGNSSSGFTTYSAGSDIGDTHIADMASPLWLMPRLTVVSGYVTDDDVTAPTPTTTELLSSTRIELAEVEIDWANSGLSLGIAFLILPPLAVFSAVIALWNAKKTYTDHNGFFFLSTPNIVTLGELDVVKVTSGTNILGPTKYNLNASAWTPPSGFGERTGIFRNTNANVTNSSRTFAQGFVVDSANNPVAGVNVTCTRGGFTVTDSNGQYSLPVYVSTTSAPAITRPDRLIFNLRGGCIASFSPSSIGPFNLAIPAVYNSSNLFLVTPSVVATIIGGGATTGLKRGGKFKWGIVYSDHALRDNDVNTNEDLELKIPFYTERTTPTGPIVGQSRPIVDWELKSLPPVWATHYQWVRTLNGNQGRFLQFILKTATYVDNNDIPAPPTQATQFKLDLGNIVDYKSQNLDSNVGYTFEEGDRAVLFRDASNNFFGDYYDLKIKGSNGGLLLYVDNILAIGVIPTGTLVEIYNPKKEAEIEKYYEIGECYEIGNPGTGLRYHKGLTQDQDPLNPVTTPATGTFQNGDVWYRFRTMPYDQFNVLNNPPNDFLSRFVEDASINDFYPSKDMSIGRFHIINKDGGEIIRPTAIRFSNVYIQNTKINGLSSFEGLNEKELDSNNGLIEKLIATQDVLLAIHNGSQINSMYIGKDVFRGLNTGQANIVALSESVIQKSYQYQGGVGTQHPQTVQIDEYGNVFGYDSNQGVVWMRTGQGIVPISDYKMISYFRNKSNVFYGLSTKNIIGAYDSYYGQYIITFEEIVPADDVVNPVIIPGETIAFSKEVGENGGWESRYLFLAESYGGGLNNTLASFKNGNFYLHHANPLYNNFYGVQYTSKIRRIFNQNPSDMKVFLYMSEEAKDAWKCPIIQTPEGQLSSLEYTDFENIENVHRADFLRDSNTPNVSNPIIFGDDLRSSVLDVELENDKTTLTTIYAVNVYSSLSQNTNK